LNTPFLWGASQGELFDACGITVDIACAVDNETVNWGALKASYK